MTATVIETNHTPFETVQVDPVDLDIIENSLRSARFEMDRRPFPHRHVSGYPRTA